MFKGSIVALITPFDGENVDEKKLRDLVDWHVEEGTHGIVPCGTTGESPTLSHAEHMRVVEVVVEQAAGRIPVMAGAGSNSTTEAIKFTQHAQYTGANAVLVVTPYYNKPSQEGLYQHYMTIADSADIPLYIYNIPGRSVIDMSVETMSRLARHDNIVGVKDATAKLERVAFTRAAIGKDFIQLSGEDATALAFNAMGGVGCISVTANIAPALCAQMQNASLEGDYAKALEIQDRLINVHTAMFCETSPAPVKFAASLLGKSAESVRLPLVAASEEARMTVREALAEAGLLNG
ncbi:4-hydroxy-tetrahydrodipicolinate synthase [Pyruvatibacter mobilis]|uniref:4-hydroxy-tetrahydrodipicolinate synthase n=1 Tax=Pyruvatibacter mobilis TaxID=1712261 RepID=A0A845QC95_9HYPH|nr:4-hydroxy-tetrahydrodipicolinate synthase [Pyruvatibacter mobilis]NBG95790.1 4-hydroxy-tetrahydrodipicolinate synthase [Pyruvatibacter mobilis]QJD74935.1 4-hydroxy-tetrahydrodipicolinate synthase [Pyruvatibacter mobilis]GGD11308.1 4-hydroxy-tetrahydrodipicolinate synthase [Pyruvatibacter mobilis]